MHESANDISNELAGNIRIAMTTKGVTERELGDALGLSQATVHRKTTSKPATAFVGNAKRSEFTLTELSAVADVLDLDPVELLPLRFRGRSYTRS